MKGLEMKSLKQKFKVYWPFTVCTIQQELSYKGRFYLFIVARLFNIFMAYYLWKAIYQSSNNAILSGFTMREMIIYNFISFITSNIVYVSISYYIGSDVVEGSIATNLIKPINYKIRLFFTALGHHIYQFIVPSIFVWIGLMIYEYHQYNSIPPKVGTLLLYLLSTFLSFIIFFYFEFCFGMLSFYTTYIWGMNVAKAALLAFLSGQVIPLVFFPAAVQHVFKYLPFASMNYVPVMIYMGKISGSELIYALIKQIIWILLFWIFSVFLWKRVTKRLSVLGG